MGAAFVTVRAVELCEVGTWELSSGPATFTSDDLAHAVEALDCPAMRAPVLKLGHIDPRFDGEPAIGRITNMAVTNEGNTLIGDYTGVPKAFGDILASAYPSRSIEGMWNFRCALGHTHPFVITAVALLGVASPGVATLEDLVGLFEEEIAAAAAAPGERFRVDITKESSMKFSAGAIRAHTTDTTTDAAWNAATEVKNLPSEAAALRAAFAWVDPEGDKNAKASYKLPHHMVAEDGTVGAANTKAASAGIATLNGARGGVDIPADEKQAAYRHLAKHLEDAGDTPAPLKASAPNAVAASTTFEDIRRAYYDGPGKASFALWIREAYFDPPQLVVENEMDESLWLVPFSLDADGQVTFHPPTQVQVTYVPVVASAPMRVAHFVTASQSRNPSASQSRPPGREGGPMDPRALLGLAADASDEAVSAKLAELKASDEKRVAAEARIAELEARKPAPVIPEGSGLVMVDEDRLAALEANAARGVAAAEAQRTEARNRYIDDAVKAGKIIRARRDYWRDYFDKDEAGAREYLDAVKAGAAAPVEPMGHVGTGESQQDGLDDELNLIVHLSKMGSSLAADMVRDAQKGA